MKKQKILWADDEIDLLKPHIFFLENKGYEVTTVTNGKDAIDLCQTELFDIIFLDESMPGITGLEALPDIKEASPNTPVVMITKNEEENLMDQAIGNKIADYLIKPVNPKQILLTIKKFIHKKSIVNEATTISYQQEFSNISQLIANANSFEEWTDVYKKIVYWELQLEQSESSMDEILLSQKEEANNGFFKFVSRNYINWIGDTEKRPIMSPDIFKKKLFPELDKKEKVFFVLIDNFRIDQWQSVKNLLSEYYTFDEDLCLSILPTATQFARNTIFSGLMPLQIKQMYPDLWVDENEDEMKNLNEEPLIQTQLDRFRRKEQFSYHKILDSHQCNKLIQKIPSLDKYDFNVVILNFIDMLSHARTESKTIKELASSEAAYRSLTLSWFKHSSTNELFKTLAEKGYKIIFTTDHDTIRVENPTKIIGDRNTSVNLRYKQGKNLQYKQKQVFDIKHPEQAGLPAPNLTTTYIFAYSNHFFAYPNNYNYYVPYYKDTFQHGGISLEEMVVPLITLTPKTL